MNKKVNWVAETKFVGILFMCLAIISIPFNITAFVNLDFFDDHLILPLFIIVFFIFFCFLSVSIFFFALSAIIEAVQNNSYNTEKFIVPAIISISHTLSKFDPSSKEDLGRFEEISKKQTETESTKAESKPQPKASEQSEKVEAPANTEELAEEKEVDKIPVPDNLPDLIAAKQAGDITSETFTNKLNTMYWSGKITEAQYKNAQK